MTTTILMPQGTSYEKIILGDGPIAYWRLGDVGGTAADSSGNGLDGTYTNSPTLVSGIVSSNFGDGAHQFVSASNQIVTVADDPLLDPGAGDFTMECWFSMSDVVRTNWYMGKRVSGDDQYGMLVTGDFAGTAGKKILVAYNDAALVYRQTITNADVIDGGIHHIVSTFNASTGAITIYVDGSSVAVTTNNSGVIPTISNSAQFRIGNATGSGAFLDGTVDEVALYNYELTPNQVARHYVSGA